jgi:hypothetical protein
MRSGINGVKRPPFFSLWVEKSRYKIPSKYIRKLLPVFNWNKYGCTIFLKFQIVENEISPHLKALPGYFLCIFSSRTCLKKPVFCKRDLLRFKVPARLYWDLLTSRRY